MASVTPAERNRGVWGPCARRWPVALVPIRDRFVPQARSDLPRRLGRNGRSKKVREKPYHISSQCGERLCRQYLHGRGADFTHPRVGQAERLACRERLPNAFFGQKPAPTFSAPRGQLITF